MKYLICLLVVVPQFAFAVPVTDCPAKLKVTYESLQAYGDKRLEKEAGIWGDGLIEEMKNERDVLKEAPFFAFQEVEYKIIERKDGRCTYLNENQKTAKGDNETRIYTRDGRVLLRVALNIGNNNFWTYHTVTALSPNSIDLKSLSTKVLGYFDHGGPRVAMGWASDVDIEALEE